VTQTTTERRVVFSPFIPGHAIGEARDEWRIPIEIARATRPEQAHLLDYPDTQAIREDIAQCVASYRGIEQLHAQGDSFQWGGPRLCDGGHFPLPEGRARFVTSEPPDARVARGQFRLTTRRGTQWNSLIQAERDGLTGADRDHVLMSAQDIAMLGIQSGTRVRLTSPNGSFLGRAFAAEVIPGHVQMHWPEANPLIARGVLDPAGLVPDYNALVSIEVPS
jgi:anaerobic selenocysteine-containing dehydrogenase